MKAAALPFSEEKIKKTILIFTNFISLQKELEAGLKANAEMVSGSKFARENPKHHENNLQLANRLRTENDGQGKRILELEQKVADEEKGRVDAESRLEPFSTLSNYKKSMKAVCSKFSTAQAQESVEHCTGLKSALEKMCGRVDRKLGETYETLNKLQSSPGATPGGP